MTRSWSALRELVTWAPAFGLLPIRNQLASAMAAGDLDGWLIIGLLLASASPANMVCAIAVPSRGLQERLCRASILPA